MGRPSGRSRRPRTLSTGAPWPVAASRFSGRPTVTSSAAPVIRPTSWRGVQAPRPRLATVSPERMTVMRSPISSSSSIRWVMKITPTPSAASRAISANNRSRVTTSSAEVASSRIRMRGRRSSARTMQQACRSLRERSSMAVDRSAGRSRSSSSAALARRRFSRAGTLVRQVSSAPSQMLSSTGRASATRTSWKTVTTPCCWADLGLRSWTSAPATSTRPESGACTPLRIFTSVLLPEPFSPTRAWTSPARSSNEQSLSAWVGPNAFATCSTRTRMSGTLGAPGTSMTAAPSSDVTAMAPRRYTTSGSLRCWQERCPPPGGRRESTYGSRQSGPMRPARCGKECGQHGRRSGEPSSRLCYLSPPCSRTSGLIALSGAKHI